MAPTAANHTAEEEPPYHIPDAILGGTPSPLPDTSIIIILLILFTLALALHLFTTYLDNTRPATTLYRINTTPSHGSPPAPIPTTSHPDPTPNHVLPFLRCFFPLTRIAALSARLAWTYNPSALRLEIASSIVASAGTVLLVIANLLITRRFLRDYAAFGFHPAVVRVTRLVIFLALVSLIMGVSVHADIYFTTDAKGLRECRAIGLAAGVIRAVCAVVPVVAVAVGGWWLCADEEVRRDRKRWMGRGMMIVGIAVLLTWEEGFRVGVAFEGREAGSRAWFLHKAAYYCFTYLLEAVILYWFLAARLLRAFRLRPKVVLEKSQGFSRRERVQDRVNTEAEVFGDSW